MIVAIGDSLTFGYGLFRDDKWVNKLGFVNAGISGDTTGGMLARLNRDVISKRPKAVFVMGGGNDFIMGADTTTVKCNITAIAMQCMAAGIKVAIGSAIPFGYGEVPDYISRLCRPEEVDSKYREMLNWYRDFCEVWGFEFIDTYTEFQKAIEREENLYLDGIHLNAKGSDVLAYLLKSRLS